MKTVGNICICRLEDLQGREKEPLADIFAQMDPDYWNGVKLVENGIYGAFQMHYGKRIKNIQTLFFLDKKRFILVIIRDEEQVFQEIQQQAVQEGLEEGIDLLFGHLLKPGEKLTEQMETYLIDMEQEIVSGRMDRNRNRAIFECKRSLTLWKNDYMQILNIAEGINGLEQKKNEQQEQLLTEGCACFFRVYENKVRRLTERIQFLYEELVHVREALDAALEYDQNRIMKVFTTVTTVFSPLTLVAGWYGMNFTSMPELGWKYGYLFVAVLSIAVIGICVFFFKKKKLL